MHDHHQIAKQRPSKLNAKCLSHATQKIENYIEKSMYTAAQNYYISAFLDQYQILLVTIQCKPLILVK